MAGQVEATVAESYRRRRPGYEDYRYFPRSLLIGRISVVVVDLADSVDPLVRAGS
jgi:hypothetical protein